MKNNTSNENRKKIWWLLLRDGKPKKHSLKRHGKEWDRKDIDDLEIKGVNVALYSVTNMSPDDQDKIYDTWFKELEATIAATPMEATKRRKILWEKEYISPFCSNHNPNV